MPGYSPDPWIYDKGTVRDANNEPVCLVSSLTESRDVNGLLIAHAILLLDVLGELHDAADKCDYREDLADALDRASGLLEKLE